MIMAITIIVIMATIMALALALTSSTTKKTVDLYLYEQSILLAHSAAEYSLLRIARGGPCSHFNDLTFTQNKIYTISITNRFIYTNPLPAGCNANNTYTSVATPEQNGSVLMDISVSVTDPKVVSEPIRYFKRSIQKL
jgi:type II secretory pathway pseudopilin PulG